MALADPETCQLDTENSDFVTGSAIFFSVYKGRGRGVFGGDGGDETSRFAKGPRLLRYLLFKTILRGEQR